MKKLISVITIIIFISAIYLIKIESVESHNHIIPIEHINEYKIPCASIKIEDKSYLVEIDLGSKTALSLHENVLRKIKKDPCGTSRRMDFLGNKYETPQYSIHNVRVGSYFLKKTLVKEESLEFSLKNSVIGEAGVKESVGRIGREFFEDKNLFLDFRHRVFMISHKLKDISKNGYEYKNLTAVPFQNTKKGIIFEITIDAGVKKLAIDTGATITAIRNSGNEQKKLETFQTSQFVMNGVDFGPRKIYLLNITPLFEGIDGFLGMDFLNEHVVYLDFTKQVAYIGKTL